jgi:hypothetical protein
LSKTGKNSSEEINWNLLRQIALAFPRAALVDLVSLQNHDSKIRCPDSLGIDRHARTAPCKIINQCSGSGISFDGAAQINRDDEVHCDSNQLTRQGRCENFAVQSVERNSRIAFTPEQDTKVFDEVRSWLRDGKRPSPWLVAQTPP